MRTNIVVPRLTPCKDNLFPKRTRNLASLLLTSTVWLALSTCPAEAATVVWNGDIPELEPSWGIDGNWFGKAAPTHGDSLVFGFSQKSNDNDFADNAPFASITFTNDSWVLGGNALTLTAGIAVLWNQSDVPSNPNVLTMPVTFANPAIISNTVPGGRPGFCRADHERGKFGYCG
jgi:hypothetical protein